jgi:peptidyl-prolyl cis-trans isomerase B (cyclophilin B)
MTINPHVMICTKYGDIIVEMFPESAPLNVANFIGLAKAKFYDGTTFHKIIPGFMIMGGCPNTKVGASGAPGAGGPGWSVKEEHNYLSHVRGTVSMARSEHPDSAGSQFFICVADSGFLDHKYTAIGTVLEGMEAADKISVQPRDNNDMPLLRIEMVVKVMY